MLRNLSLHKIIPLGAHGNTIWTFTCITRLYRCLTHNSKYSIKMLVYNYIHSHIAKLILSVWSVYFENKLSAVLSTGRTAPQWVGYLLSINRL